MALLNLVRQKQSRESSVGGIERSHDASIQMGVRVGQIDEEGGCMIIFKKIRLAAFCVYLIVSKSYEGNQTSNTLVSQYFPYCQRLFNSSEDRLKKYC